MADTRGRSGKSWWILLLFMLAGLVVGFFLGNFFLDLSKMVDSLSFLEVFGFSKSFGLENAVVDLIVITLQLSFTIKVSLCGLICMIISIFIYRRL